MKLRSYIGIEKEWLDSLDPHDRELVHLRAKLDTRTALLRLSLGLNSGLIGGFILDLVLRLNH